jgi:hypothetical protein
MKMDDALRLTNARVKMGRLIPVWNKGHNEENAEDPWRYALWVEDQDGGNERCLMMSVRMVKTAEALANLNKEDIPKRNLITDMLD